MYEQRPRRNRKSGIVLISTLLSMILIIGIWSYVQATSLSNSLVLAKISKNVSSQTHIDAASQIFAPLIVQALTDPDNGDIISLDGTPYEISFQDKKYAVNAQDVEGLIDLHLARKDVAEQLLPNDVDSTALFNVPNVPIGLTLEQSLALAGIQAARIHTLEQYFTQHATKAKFNMTTLHSGYQSVRLARNQLMLTHPQLLRIRIVQK